MNEYHKRMLEAIDAATAGMTEEQLSCHEDGKWCAAEILEHLALAFGHTATMLSRCIQAGKPLGGPPTLKQRLMSAIVVDVGYIPTGRKAPKITVPSGALNGKQAIEKIRANLYEMDRLYLECQQKVTDRGWLANHPVLGPLKMAQWPKFHWIHTRHHMKQIQQMKAR